MAIVTVNQGESIESALRRFKRKVMTEEIMAVQTAGVLLLGLAAAHLMRAS